MATTKVSALAETTSPQANDELLIKTRCIKVKSSSLVLDQLIENSNISLIEAEVEIASIDEVFFKPTLIPKKIKELMEIIEELVNAQETTDK